MKSLVLRYPFLKLEDKAGNHVIILVRHGENLSYFQNLTACGREQAQAAAEFINGLPPVAKLYSSTLFQFLYSSTLFQFKCSL